MSEVKLMRSLIMVLLALLLVGSVAALTPLEKAGYVTVVDDSGGSTAVITAAEFAAHMQVYGTTFTGAVESMITWDLLNVDEKFLVFIEGDDVTIVDGMGDTDSAVRTREYFEARDFDVRVDVLQEFLGPKPMEDEEDDVIVPQELKDCEGCLFGDQCLAEGTRVASKYCDKDGDMMAVKARGDDCVYSYECWSRDCRGTCFDEEETPPPPPEDEDGEDTPAEKKSFVKKFFSWLAGLFS